MAFTVTAAAAASPIPAGMTLITGSTSCSVRSHNPSRGASRTGSTLNSDTLEEILMSVLTATSWSHLQELIFTNSWDAGIQRHRSRHAFRGVSDQAHKLDSGLMRLGGPYL